MKDRLKINEIFYSIQGESTFAGRPCVLIRLPGCQMRCRWCDSEYSFYEGDWRSLDRIVEEVDGYGCPLVEITGGEPLLQPAVHPLMTRFCDRGFEVLLETGGGLDISGVDSRVRRIVDVKCPGSGEVEGNRLENLDLLRELDEVKFVLADRDDYEWARDLSIEKKLSEKCAVLFSAVHGVLEARDLAVWVLDDGLRVRVQLQLHKLLFGAETRGI